MRVFQFYLSILGILIVLQPLSAHAQRTQRSKQPNSRFIPATPQITQRSIDLMGLELGMTLTQVKSIIEGQGGEVFWSGSTDTSFTRSRETLQRGSNSYFSYQAHSIPRSEYKMPGKPGASRARPDLGINIRIKLAFYPKTKGGLKNPDNLVLYYMTTHLGFQPSYLEISRGITKPFPITVADYDERVQSSGYHLKQLEQSMFIYTRGAGTSIATGDLSLPLRQWTVQRERKQVCAKLMTEASNTAKSAGALAPVMVTYDPVTAAPKKTYIAYKDRIALRRAKITYDQLDACGTVSLTQPMTISSPGLLNGELLNSVSVQHTSAQAIGDAHEGFFNALHR